MELSDFFKDRRVLITGHTGFKGAWLTLWLRSLGAQVTGIALDPGRTPGLLEQFELDEEIDHNLIDIRDAKSLNKKILQSRPEIVFHLAAQALVRRSYREPIDTWTTNVIGTLNVLEAMRSLPESVVGVMITSDKVYLNREWQHGYRETDSLGGHDPYSSSKAAAEIAVSSWRSSFFSDPLQTAVATARAGNVLGGGDWAEDRIVPDIVRNFSHSKPLGIRCPQSTRPWQHVLEPLNGYLRLAQRMRLAQENENSQQLTELCGAWNFGPLPESNRTVAELVLAVTETWPGTWTDDSTIDSPHEAKFLGLSIDKACRQLGWYPRWDFRQCIGNTMSWYQRVLAGEHPRLVAEEQIRAFQCVSSS